MIRLITGYRKDQSVAVAEEEAHKAYYLFLHPEARTVFSDGLAIKGSDITRIEPNYQAAMGWNPAHMLGPDDWRDIRAHGIDRKMQTLMVLAKEVAQRAAPEDLRLTLSEVVKKYPELTQAPERKRIG